MRCPSGRHVLAFFTNGAGGVLPACDSHKRDWITCRDCSARFEAKPPRKPGRQPIICTRCRREHRRAIVRRANSKWWRTRTPEERADLYKKQYSRKKQRDFRRIIRSEGAA